MDQPNGNSGTSVAPSGGVASGGVVRKPVSHRLVWVGLVVLALVILAVFGGGYWLMVRYEAKAARHIPQAALGAVRVDVEQVVLYEPVRKHIFPVLDGPEPGGRLERFKQLSGVNLGMDLREVVIAALPDGETVIAIGGLFPPKGLVQALAPLVAPTAGRPGCSPEAGVLRCPSAFIRQADDGTLLLATSMAALDAAEPVSDWAQQNALPAAPLAGLMRVKSTPLGGTATGALARVGWLAKLGGLAKLGWLARFEWLGDVERLTVATDLGDPLNLEVGLDGLGAERVGEVKAAVVALQAWSALNPGSDIAGERELLARLEVAEAAGRPVVRTTWSRQDLDRGVRALADVVHALVAPFDDR